GGHHAIAQLRTRVELRHRLRERVGRGAQRQQLRRALETRLHMRLELAALLAGERVKRVDRGAFPPDLVIVHVGAHSLVSTLFVPSSSAALSASRSFSSPCLIRVLIVPSGCSRCSAISTCVNPS